MSIKGEGGGGGGGSGNPGLPLNSIQFNLAGAFGGDANLTWLAADGMTMLKHAAFGADAVIDSPTFGGYVPSPIVVNIEESFTTDSETALLCICEFNPSIAAQSAYGGYFELDTKTGNATNTSQLVPLSSLGKHLGTGVLDSITSIASYVYNTSTGTITDAYGFYTAGVTNAAGGTVTNLYGLFVSTPFKAGGSTISNAWGLLIQDQNAGGTNFAIQTGLGTVSFGDNVVTTADMKAATYHVGAAAGIDASITTAALVGKTITVSKGIITGFS